MKQTSRILIALTLVAALTFVPITYLGVTNTRAETGGWDSGDLPQGAMRQAPLDVKIVFIGIKQSLINISDGYFEWNLPPYHIQRETWFGTNWGINFTFTYSYIFNLTFDNDFFNYIHFGLGVRKDAVLTNPYNGINGWYRFYNANKVEEWLYSNPQGYGGIPANGYVLFLINVTYRDAYIPEVRQHYYNLTYTDIDSGGTVTGDWYGQWMTGWGGHHRLYYIDISAGVSATSVKAWNPLQKWWNRYFPPAWNLNVNLGANNGINFLNRYLSDFVFGAVYDCFSEDFLYPPRMAPAPNLHYNITIIIFDNCTDYANKTLEGVPLPYGPDFAIDKSEILKSFQALIPFATWTVNLTHVHQVGPGPGPYGTLWQVIRDAERTTDAFGNSVQYVDRDVLYRYLQAHLADFGLAQLAGQLLIPVFVFVFKGTFNLGYQYEGYEYDNYWGFGYPDVVLVSHSLYDLTGIPPPPPPPVFPKAPQGFTQTIIHEVGHAVGLIHPFWWDYDEDYVASAMAYYPYEYMFSQFDKDAIQRGYADYYIIRAQSMMENTTAIKQWKQMNSTLLAMYSSAGANLTSGLTAYGSMDYATAMSRARTSYELCVNFVTGASQQPTAPQPVPVLTTLGVVGMAAAFVIGLVIGTVLLRIRQKKPKPLK